MSPSLNAFVGLIHRGNVRLAKVIDMIQKFDVEASLISKGFFYRIKKSALDSYSVGDPVGDDRIYILLYRILGQRKFCAPQRKWGQYYENKQLTVIEQSVPLCVVIGGRSHESSLKAKVVKDPVISTRLGV